MLLLISILLAISWALIVVSQFYQWLKYNNLDWRYEQLHIIYARLCDNVNKIAGNSISPEEAATMIIKIIDDREAERLSRERVADSFRKCLSGRHREDEDGLIYPNEFGESINKIDLREHHPTEHIISADTGVFNFDNPVKMASDGVSPYVPGGIQVTSQIVPVGPKYDINLREIPQGAPINGKFTDPVAAFPAESEELYGKREVSMEEACEELLNDNTPSPPSVAVTIVNSDGSVQTTIHTIEDLTVNFDAVVGSDPEVAKMLKAGEGTILKMGDITQEQVNKLRTDIVAHHTGPGPNPPAQIVSITPEFIEHEHNKWITERYANLAMYCIHIGAPPDEHGFILMMAGRSNNPVMT